MWREFVRPEQLAHVHAVLDHAVAVLVLAGDAAVLRLQGSRAGKEKNLRSQLHAAGLTTLQVRVTNGEIEIKPLD